MSLPASEKAFTILASPLLAPAGMVALGAPWIAAPRLLVRQALATDSIPINKDIMVKDGNAHIRREKKELSVSKEIGERFLNSRNDMLAAYWGMPIADRAIALDSLIGLLIVPPNAKKSE